MGFHETEEMLSDCESVATVPIENGGPGFSNWELDFLESIREQWNEKKYLSEKQIAVLEDMVNKI